MIKNVINLFGKIIGIVFVFYIFLGFIVIPVTLSWGIKNKGSEFLKRPVTVHDVRFNPLILKLTLFDFGVADQGNNTLIGFHKLIIDFSFKELLKKKFVVELFDLEGLKINMVLAPSGKINLLDLIPSTSAPAQDSQSSKSKANLESKPKDFPLIIFDVIKFRGGELTFTDATIVPQFVSSINDLDIDIIGLSTSLDTKPKINVHAQLNHQGRLNLELVGKPFVQPLQLETVVQLQDYALKALTPYVGKYTGRELKGGRLNFKIDYRIADQQLAASHKILIQHFEFGEHVESKDAVSLPFGLAVALLEDPQGRINIALPVKGDMKDPKFEYWPLVGQVARNFFIKLVTKPFAVLGSVLGSESGTEELAYVRFLPGSSEISVEEKEKLKILVNGLMERPKLILEIPGAYDSAIDWKAIKNERLDQDFKKLRIESTKNDLKVYQQLYQRRFGIRQLWQVSNKYKNQVGTYEGTSLLNELKRQLIEDAPPDKIAVHALAMRRAQAIEALITSLGLQSRRISVVPALEVMSSMGTIPMEFRLTIFDSDAPEKVSNQ